MILTYIFYFYQLISIKKEFGVSKTSIIFATVASIPYGKMIYVPIFSNAANGKLSYLLVIVTVLIVFRKNILKDSVFIFSFLFLYLGALYYGNPVSQDLRGLEGLNTLYRVTIFLLFFLFTLSIIYYTDIKKIRKLAFVYIQGTLFTTIVGLVMFYMIFQGLVSENDLKIFIVAGDIHIVGNFFRFNPGSNVNEFSQILVYAIILLFYFESKLMFNIILFHLALLMTLTRFSWIGYLIALFGFNIKKAVIFIFILVVSILCIYMLVDDNIRLIIESRFALDMGASGDDRIGKFLYVYESLSNNIFRLLFGYGFSTNLYVHSVYLQLLYEIGIIGLLIISMLLYKYFFRYINNRYSLAIFIFIIVESIAHHILYLSETWFAIAMMVLISKKIKYDKLVIDNNKYLLEKNKILCKI